MASYMRSSRSGDYDAVFRISNWKSGIVERCLVEYCERYAIANTIAFLAASTDYAKIIRRTPWSTTGASAFLVSADLHGRKGALVRTPRTLGVAIGAYVNGELSADWRASDGSKLVLERIG